MGVQSGHGIPLILVQFAVSSISRFTVLMLVIALLPVAAWSQSAPERTVANSTVINGSTGTIPGVAVIDGRADVLHPYDALSYFCLPGGQIPDLAGVRRHPDAWP